MRSVQNHDARRWRVKVKRVGLTLLTLEDFKSLRLYTKNMIDITIKSHSQEHVD